MKKLFGTIIFLNFTLILFGQNTGRYWKNGHLLYKYKLSSMVSEDEVYEIERLESKIKKGLSGEMDIYESFYSFHYNDLYDLANENIPDCRGETNKECRAPKIAKACAFILLIGLNKAGNALTAQQETVIETNLYNAFQKMDPVTHLGSLINVFATSNYLHWRSKDLIHYLQAYDLARGAGYEDGSFPLFSVKKDLNKFTGNLHSLSKGFIYPNKNNKTLMVAGALGLAAIVINDYGKRLNGPLYWPEEWMKTARIKN